ncbi:MAG: cytochrome C oxidase subunit IV family protein [Pirellulaceae bacterium]|nr:cytochrome C oxidase subunit IV family protein [Pirellulaceae bacterium]
MTEPTSSHQHSGHSASSAASHGNDSHGHGAGEHGHGGVGKYILVFLALCVLTSASFFTVSPLWPFHDTPAVGWTFMMAVSCTKAMLVISFFMHLIWEANWKYVLTIPASIMSIFLVLMLVPDVGERTLHYSSSRWLHAAQPRAAAAHGDHGDHESHGDDGHADHPPGESAGEGGGAASH